MRVLLVSHLFPPRHSAGTEVYTAELGKRLVARGHEVRVLTTNKDISRADLTLVERDHEGLPVFEVVNNLFLDDFRQTWDRHEIDGLFAQLADDFAPDVVHFHHLMYLSVGCLEEARRRAIPVVFTLHDFWLQCPRFGQLLHADGSLCETVDFVRCGTCLPSFGWKQSDLQRKAGRAIARVRGATGVNFGPLARNVVRIAQGRRPAPEWSEPDLAAAEEFERSARERSEALQSRVLESVDRFISPSRFLRERFVDWGIPEDRIRFVPTGVDASAFSTPPRTRSDHVRVSFVGTLVEIKGAHLLLDAWGRLSDSERARGELRLYGPGKHAPEYLARLQTRASEVGATLYGSLARDEVPRVLAETDLLVVPSLWFENRPLIVLEALATRTPLLVSEPGGMAELVEEGVSGWRFPIGDASALADRLRGLLTDRSPLDGLYSEEVRLPDWKELTEATLEVYDEVLASRAR